MKKTLAALAVATLAAGSANAAVVYEQDGTKVEVGGSARIFLGKLGDDKRGDLYNNKSRLTFKASQDIGSGFSALAAWQLRFADKDGRADNGTSPKRSWTNSSNSFGDPYTHELYAGLKYDQLGTLTFGRQNTTADDIGDLVDYTYTLGGNNNLRDYAAKGIKFRSIEWGGFSFGADYIFGQSDKTSLDADYYKNGYGFGIFYTRDLVQDLTLNFNAGYTQDRFDDNQPGTETGEKATAYRFASELVFGPLSFGAEYGETRTKYKSAVTEKLKSLEVAARYQIIEPSAIYLQWINDRTTNVASGSNKKTENGYLAGVDYRFNKNVVTYIEYGNFREKDHSTGEKEKDNKFGAGFRVYF